MNDTTRDELRDEILGYFEQINSHLDSHDSFTDAEMRSNVNEIIALVTAARDAEIRELLLSDKTVEAAAVEWLGTPLKGDLEHMNRILNCAAVYIGLGDGAGGQG